MNSFVTSIPAQAAARCIIETARSLHLLDQPVAYDAASTMALVQ